MIDTGLAGRVALVTGANHGIGAATAVALASQGVAVFGTYLRIEPDEHEAGDTTPAAYTRARASGDADVVRRVREAGGRAEFVEADLADPATPAALLDAAEAAFGPVEILVNNASGWLKDTFVAAGTDRYGRHLRPVDADSIERQFAVDVRAATLLIAEFARRHIARGATWGRIVGLTSGGAMGFAEEVSYGAAKAAQENYTLSAASELGRYGVTANMVQPPITDTGWITPDVAELAETHSPLRSYAMPEDVADVICYLASHQARRVTGQKVHLY